MNDFSISEKIALFFLKVKYQYYDLKQKLNKHYILKVKRIKNQPNAVNFHPRDFHIADPTIAEDIYDGHISLVGMSYNVGANSPFNIKPPNQEWHQALIAFRWLRHFKAVNSRIILLQARAMFIDWTQSDIFYEDENWQLGVTSKRLIALLSHSDIILDNAGEEFHQKFFKIIEQHIQILSRNLKNAKYSRHKLEVAIALSFAKTCLNQDYQFPVKKMNFEDLLAKRLNDEILADGGHISRNPDVLLEIMLDLIPLKSCFLAQGFQVPQILQNAIDRIIPILHFFCHPDGNFIQFNGAGPTDWAAFLSIFDAEGEGFNPPTQAPHSGYYRLYAPGLQLTLDAGSTPPAQYSTQAHAAPLAFELSISGQRVIVNCGAAPSHEPKWFYLTRSTPAHSTLSINDQSTAMVKLPKWLREDLGDQLYHGHDKMPVKIGRTPKGAEIDTSHAGWQRQYGIMHQRNVILSQDGELITGIDRLTPDPKSRIKHKAPLPYDIRFHLHPSVATRTSKDGHSILLILPNQEVWQFLSTFATFALEESVYLGESHEKTQTTQIVISGQYEEYAEAKWQFRKL